MFQRLWPCLVQLVAAILLHYMQNTMLISALLTTPVQRHLQLAKMDAAPHTDYGTFSIIFQDGTAGLEIEAPEKPGTWLPVPGDATLLLCGWCAVVLSGSKVAAARYRVRRVPGVRRLSAVLFVAPDLDIKMAPEGRVERFSDAVNEGPFSTCAGSKR
jgi:isopenicillin N synthase-like dioxygenase